MKTCLHLSILIAVFALLLSAAACQPETPPTLPMQAEPSGNKSGAPLAQAPAATVPVAAPQEPAAAVLPDPAAGLANIKAYRAVLVQDTNGSLDGQPFERHTRIEYRRDAAGNEEIKQHIIGTGEVPFNRHLILLGGALYELNETGEMCDGSVPELGDHDFFAPPASFLLPVGKAEPAGREAVNELPARHYLFDASGLKQAETSGAVSGETWLAEDGGQVVRYRLEAAAPANLTGKGLEAALKWQYDLTLPDSQEDIRLPETCPPVNQTAPLPQDAQEVQRSGGMTSFHTAAAAGDVFVFYQQKLPALGWRLITPSLPEPLKLPFLLNAEKDKLTMTIRLDAGETGGLDVDITVVDLAVVEAFAQVTPQVPPAPQPTVDPAVTGLPDDIPFYPGSYDLKKLPNGTLIFKTNIRLNAVSKFYYDKMDELGWWILETHSLADSETATWVKDKRQVMFAATQKGSAVQIMINQVTTP